MAYSLVKQKFTRFSAPSFDHRPNFAYIPQLDTIRAGCIFFVFLAHAGYGDTIPGGAFGVTVFFFLSGFLITRLLLSEYIESGSINIPTFYARRFLRLAPALMAMICVVTSIYWTITSHFPSGEFAAAVLYYTNYYKISHPVMDLPLSILWSISVEEHYYLIFPFLFTICLRRFGIERLFVIVASIAATVLIWRVSIVVAGWASYEWVMRATDTRIDSILYGSLLSILLASRFDEVWLKLCRSTLALGIAIGILLLTLLVGGDVPRLGFRFTFQGMALMVIMTHILFSEAGGPYRFFMDNRFLIWLGKLSYSLYLWHSACIHAVHWMAPNLSKPAALILYGVCAMSIAAFSFYCIERNFNRFRKKFGSHLAR